MKVNCLFLVLSSFLLTLPTLLRAQIGFNSPAGVTITEDVEAYSQNGFLWQQKYQYVSADPNASVNNLTCGGANLTANAGILKDPSGDLAYSDVQSTTCTQTIYPSASADGIELIFEDLNTEFVVDYILITDPRGRERRLSGSILPKRIVISGFYTIIKFVTNGNGSGGRGFRLQWRTLKKDNSSSGSSVAFGTSLEFSATNASFHAGDANQASGRGSVAMGVGNTATGNYSSALGVGNDTQGDYGVALGLNNEASGDYSTAIGNYVSTNNFTGAFILGDHSTGTTVTLATAQNQFTGRFAGGYRLFTNTATTLGVQLSAGGNAWSSISDSTKKERFLPISHPDLLTKIRTLKLGTWNYKGQRDQRHYGPMAQDFFARFGHDGLGVIGCDTLLNSHDFTAVTLSGVQALALENEQLKAEIDDLKRERLQTAARLEALERAVFVRKAPRTTLAARRKNVN